VGEIGSSPAVEQWTFFGRISPERIRLSIRVPVKFISESNELSSNYEIQIQIADGQFVAAVVVTSGAWDMHTLKKIVESDIRKITDIIGFRHGASFDVVMIRANCDDGRTVVFEIPVLEHSRVGVANTLDSKLIDAVVSNIPAQMALADFREAMRNPMGTGFFCYRAVEAVMQSMKAEPEDEDGAWDMLCQRLQVDRSTIETIKAHADYPRYGKISSISDVDRATVFRLTDEIVKRYLDYIQRGSAPLSATEYPLFSV